MKKSYIIALASAFSLATAACSKKDDPTTATTEPTQLTADINSAQQVPVNNSAATGTFEGTYTPATKQLTYKVTYQGLVPSNAHIHAGTPGVTGPVAISFVSLANPITGTATLTASQADQLLNNSMYVNIHSTAFPDGEIRGNIKKK